MLILVPYKHLGTQRGGRNRPHTHAAAGDGAGTLDARHARAVRGAQRDTVRDDVARGGRLRDRVLRSLHADRLEETCDRIDDRGHRHARQQQLARLGHRGRDGSVAQVYARTQQPNPTAKHKIEVSCDVRLLYSTVNFGSCALSSLPAEARPALVSLVFGLTLCGEQELTRGNSRDSRFGCKRRNALVTAARGPARAHERTSRMLNVS